MSKNEQTVKAISEMINRLKAEKAEFNKTTDDKIAGLEIAYEALTGEKSAKPAAPAPSKRRGMKIDRQSAAKTYAFLQERAEKPTTVKMIARKFNISEEAASQRVLKLFKDGQAVRVALGQYVDKAVVKTEQASVKTAEA